MDELLKNSQLTDRRIILFGCTMWTKTLVEYLDIHNLPVEAIVDNNQEKTGGKCLGIDIYSPEYLSVQSEKICVLICSSYWLEMSKQLNEMGYVSNKNYFILPYKDNEAGLSGTCCKVLRGYYIYKRLIKRLRGRNPCIFICPYGGSGDIYMAGLFFLKYLEKNDVDEYCFVVEGNLARKVAGLFKISNIKVINENEKKALLSAYQFFGKDVVRIKPLLYWGWHAKSYPNPDAKMDVTFLEVMKYDVYRHEADVIPAPPVFNDDRDYVEQLLNKNKLSPGRTVILAPYAGSFKSDISPDIWERIAEGLSTGGYSVCTNSAGGHEPAIKGTIPIYFPLEHAVPVLDYAGGFIGIRSGFCDLTSSCSCKYVVLYERALNAVKYNYFSFTKMGLNNNAREFVYASENDNAFIEQVLSVFSI